MLYLGIDLGTSSVKAVVYNEYGSVIATASEKYNFALYSNVRELDGDNIWDCTKKALSHIAAEKSVSDRLAGIAVSSFGEAFVALDRYGNVLTPIVVGNDNRADLLFDKYSCMYEPEYIAANMGVHPSPTYSAAKMLYIKYNLPDIYERIDCFLMIGDYINYKLCGIKRSEYSLASRTMLFNVYKKKWDTAFIECLGLDKKKFSKPVCSGEIIGEIKNVLASELGLTKKVMIIAGGHDQPCCTLGGGDVANTLVCSMGTSEAMSFALDKPLPVNTVLKYCFPCEPYLAENRYSSMMYNPAGGILVKWFFDTFCKADFINGKPPYKLFEHNAPDGPTTLIVLPYPAGRGTPRLDNAATMQINGLNLGTNRYELYKALLEGMCFEQKYNTELVKNTGQRFDRIIAVGGGTDSLLWLQIKADILNMPIHLTRCKEVASLGCSIICAVALGRYKSIAEAASKMTHITDTIYPSRTMAEFYEERYGKYLSLVAID
ncbi:MAG: FGGY family carbohydrate kinase [Eubacteriales bacterium]|nr:FGGY family carbohydrate kinase [Eubacteriales bacterium]